MPGTRPGMTSYLWLSSDQVVVVVLVGLSSMS